MAHASPAIDGRDDTAHTNADRGLLGVLTLSRSGSPCRHVGQRESVTVSLKRRDAPSLCFIAFRGANRYPPRL